MDRATGLISLIFIGATGLFVSSSFILQKYALSVIFTALIFLALIFLVLFTNKIAGGVESFSNHFLNSEKNSKSFRVFLNKVINSILVFRGSYKILAISLFYGALFQFLATAGIYFLSLSIGINIYFIDLLWINALASIILVLPVTVLGLGLREGSFVYLLGLLGISNASALSFSLLVSFFYLSINALGGTVELYENLFFKNTNVN